MAPKRKKEPLKNYLSKRKLQIPSENFERPTKPYQVMIRRGGLKSLQPEFAICSSKIIFQRFRTGFSLVETIIAISIIGVVIVAAAQLTQRSMAIGKNTMDRLIALHYAEEGLEIVRNIRDSNWLQNKIWREGLADGTYVVTGGLDAKAPFGLSPALTFLAAPAASGVATDDFSRIIGISSLANNSEIEVTSTVKYRSRGESKEIKLKAKFTDWKKGPI